jgi:hypothetical protein
MTERRTARGERASTHGVTIAQLPVLIASKALEGGVVQDDTRVIPPGEHEDGGAACPQGNRTGRDKDADIIGALSCLTIIVVAPAQQLGGAGDGTAVECAQ